MVRDHVVVRTKVRFQAENANLNVPSLMRTLAQAVEHHYPVQLTQEHALLPCMARHTGCFITRFVVRPNDMTAIRRLSDREYGGSIADICERVLYQKQGWIESETPAERSRCITCEMLEWSVRTKGCQSRSDRFVAKHTNERRDRKEKALDGGSDRSSHTRSRDIRSWWSVRIRTSFTTSTTHNLNNHSHF